MVAALQGHKPFPAQTLLAPTSYPEVKQLASLRPPRPAASSM
jgi:hypothetical protein